MRHCFEGRKPALYRPGSVLLLLARENAVIRIFRFLCAAAQAMMVLDALSGEQA
jgi:hypothetical protein